MILYVQRTRLTIGESVMNIKNMRFQTDNSNGGRLSKIERAMFNITSRSRRDYFHTRHLYLHDAPKESGVSKSSIYRYWQYMHDNDISYSFNGMVVAARENLGIRMFSIKRSAL